MQHTEIPHELDNLQERLSKTEEDIKNHPERILQSGDKIVYASIRSFMDETRTCYPSISKIKERAKCGQAKILSAIKRLEKAGFIKTSYKKLDNGKISHFYQFPKTKFDESFEMFTLDFLLLDIPANIKEYYMDIQKYMYGKDSGVGRIGYSNTKLSELTGISLPSIKKYNNYLIAHGFLEEEPTGQYDNAGLPVIKKEFNLNTFQQAMLWAKAVTQQVQENTEDINEVKEKLDKALLRISELERQQALSKIKDAEIISETYHF